MPRNDDALQPRLATLAAERRRELGDPPSVETLSAYLAGELTESERDRIQEHLAVNPELAETLLDLEEFERDEPAADEPRLSERDLDERWLRMRERLGTGATGDADEAAPSPAPTAPAVATAAPFRHDRRPSSTILALAALLMVAVGVGGWWIGRSTTSGVAPAVVAEVLPAGSFATRSAEPIRVEVPAWAERVVLVLPVNPPGPARPTGGYRLEIHRDTGDGERQVLGTRAEPAADGSVTQVLPTALLSPGPYTARVYRLEDGPPEPIATYRFEVISVPPAGRTGSATR